MLPIHSNTDTLNGLGVLGDSLQTLGAYGDVYTVTDLRKRARKEPGEVKSLSTKSLDIKLLKKAPVKSPYDNDKHVKINVFKNANDDVYYTEIPFFMPTINQKDSWTGYDTYNRVVVDKSKLFDLKNVYSNEWNTSKYTAYVTVDYYAELKKKAIKRQVEINNKKIKEWEDENKFWGKNSYDKYIKEYKKQIKYLYKYYPSVFANELSAPVDSELNAVPEIYNTDILFCKGFTPTYVPLKDYGFMFPSANMKNQLNGYGFDFTIDQLKNTVKHHWRECAIIAKHLKGDTLEQSCFNIWHWLHKNIRYNYDAPGKEQIRTPRRVWADRAKGVDCDCLAVFTYCTLACMGYQPKFEIVAFKNRDQFSHIYIVCGNVVVDRCLPWFNQRPQNITKIQQVMIPVYELNGVNGLGYADSDSKENSIMLGLSGLYHDTLLKIGTHTATKKDYTNFRKAKLMLQLQGEDHNAFVLAGLLLPYITDIDNNGGMYFDNEHVANVAVAAERQLNALELNPDTTQEDLGKLFKKIGKALKKAAKSVGKAVKTVAKTTAKATKAVVKSTAKVVKAAAKATAKVTKAAVKSTANVVKAAANLTKAGAQAITGKGTKAKETLRKAGSQIKSAVTQPVKAMVQSTKAVLKTTATAIKDVVKDAVVNPTKELIVKPVVKTVKFAGKLIKVIFVKINPITVLMRQSLRMLISLNFVGMATRLNVGNLTEQQAINAGYTKEQWEEAKQAKKRVVKFFTTMGGKAANIEKAIEKGAKKKALFKKDYKPTQSIKTVGEDDASLGDPASIGAALVAVGGFLAKIWGWIKKIVPVAKKVGKGIVKATKKTAEVAKKVGQGVAKATKKTVEVAKKVVNKIRENQQNAAQDQEQIPVNKGTGAQKQQVVKQSAPGLSTTAKVGIGIGAGALLLLLVMNKKKA